MKTSLTVLSTAIAASQLSQMEPLIVTPSSLRIPRDEFKEPKNKYNLTEEQKDYLSKLTPKEKKVYLKGLGVR